jgi:hypothetical protein
VGFVSSLPFRFGSGFQNTLSTEKKTLQVQYRKKGVAGLLDSLGKQPDDWGLVCSAFQRGKL